MSEGFYDISDEVVENGITQPEQPAAPFQNSDSTFAAISGATKDKRFTEDECLC